MVEEKSEYDNDVFETIVKNFDKIHQSMEQLTPMQTQSMSNLQQASLKSWKNVAHSSISILQAYAGQNSGDPGIHKISKNLLDTITDELIKGIKLQSNFAKIYWDITKQNLEEINRNTVLITELTQKFASNYQQMVKKDEK